MQMNKKMPAATLVAALFVAAAIMPQSMSAAGPTAYGQASLVSIARGFGSPDDLIVTQSGDIIFGDFSNRALNIIKAGSVSTSPVAFATGITEPEGIVVAKDGALIVANQTTNHILEVNRSTGSIRLLHQMVNRTGKEGVDGLGLDPATGDILIPDSPNGTLLRMSRDGSRITTIASGFVRPTGAAVEKSGSIVVADEFGNAVYRISSSGRRTVLAYIYQPDDVVVGPDGGIYVNALRGYIYRIDPVTLHLTMIASGLTLPHGIGFDPQGRLVVASAGLNRIYRITLK